MGNDDPSLQCIFYKLNNDGFKALLKFDIFCINLSKFLQMYAFGLDLRYLSLFWIRNLRHRYSLKNMFSSNDSQAHLFEARWSCMCQAHKSFCLILNEFLLLLEYLLIFILMLFHSFYFHIMLV